MENNRPEEGKTPEQVRQRKAYWISFAIAFGVSLALAVGSFFLIKEGFGLDFETHKWRIFADTFTLPGVTFLMVFLLVKVSNFGAFDALAYSVRLALTLIIHSNVRKSKLPANYRDYRLAKMSKKRASVNYLLFIGIFYLVLAVIFIGIYYVNLPQ